MRISDWSSDVCSSDLRLVAERIAQNARLAAFGDHIARLEIAERDRQRTRGDVRHVLRLDHRIAQQGRRLSRCKGRLPDERRSEERRVGKEGVRTCSTRGSTYQSKKKNKNNLKR